MRRIATALAVAFALAGAAHAQEKKQDPTPPKAPEKAPDKPAPDKSKGPEIVNVGIYLTQIYSLDIKGNSFTADFYMWFRWKSDEIKPHETFELSNGRIDRKDVLEQKKIKTPEGEFNYANLRVVGIVTEFFDVRNFPLDRHDLRIEIEDSKDTEDAVKYVADVANTGIDPRVTVRGYNVTGAAPTVESHEYRTNYGDTSLPTGNASAFTRYNFVIKLDRPDYGVLLKLYWSVVLSVLIAFLALCIKPTDLDPRFGLGVGAVFAASASSYVISSYLPDTNYVTLADKLGFVAISFIFISLGESTISLKLATSERQNASKWLDRISVVVMSALYFGLSAMFVINSKPV